MSDVNPAVWIMDRHIKYGSVCLNYGWIYLMSVQMCVLWIKMSDVSLEVRIMVHFV
jgi:hypothetical protein